MQQITVFIDLQDQLNMFRKIFVHHQERKTANYSMWYGGLLWWWVCGKEGGSMVLCAWFEGRCLILQKKNPSSIAQFLRY
jgi:hypothetical protein